MSFEQCVRESKKDNRLTQTPLQFSGEYVTVPEEAIQSDLFPELPPAVGYKDIITALDVFSRYLSAYTTKNQKAKKTAGVIINIMIKHAYIPTTIHSDKWSTFIPQLIKNVEEIPGITLQNARIKQTQTFGLLE